MTTKTLVALKGPILIYGAGGKGRQIANFLSKLGHPLLGFADIRANQKDSHEGLPVKSIKNWITEISPSETTLIVAIHNHLASVGDLLQELDSYGFFQVLTSVDFHRIFSGLIDDHYWLTSTDFYGNRERDFAFIKSLFSDEISEDLLNRIIQFRVSGDYRCLPPPSTTDQYCPTDLPRWSEPLRFVDCGAYDGDTIRNFQSCGYSFSAIAAFEPDYSNFRQLTRTLSHIPSSVGFPCSVGASTCIERFSASGDMASRISADSDIIVQCVALDEALSGFRPSLIKMDIEGSELDALRGAKAIICDSRPALAISVYHRPSDLWEIPQLLVSWELKYSYHLRCHGHNSFDLVLYALPEG